MRPPLVPVWTVGFLLLIAYSAMVGRANGGDWRTQWTCAAPLGDILDPAFFAVPYRFNGKDVECASLDGKRCWRNGCQVPAMLTGTQRLKPLACGAAHKSVWGFTGYNTPGHWCSALKVFYRAPVEYCKKHHMVLSTSMRGCMEQSCDKLPGASFGFACLNNGYGGVGPSIYLMNRCKSKGPLFVVTRIDCDPIGFSSGWERLDYGKTLFKCGTKVGFDGMSRYYVHTARKVSKVVHAAQCRNGATAVATEATHCVIEEGAKFSIYENGVPKFVTGLPEGYNDEIGGGFSERCDKKLHPNARQTYPLQTWGDPKQPPCGNSSMVIFTQC